MIPGWQPFKRILALPCSGAAQLLSDAMDRPLSWDERLAVSGHLLACLWCRRYRRQLDFLSRVSLHCRHHSQLGSPHQLPPAARQRIQAVVLQVLRHRGST